MVSFLTFCGFIIVGICWGVTNAYMEIVTVKDNKKKLKNSPAIRSND